MKILINYIIFAIIIFNVACSPLKEYIIDTQTGEKVVGYTADCKYRIGKTKKADFPQIFWDQIIKDSSSIQLSFNYVSYYTESKTLLSGGSANSRFSTSRGLKPGDSIEKALKLYGKPVATDLLYWEDKQHRIRWSFEGLFYKNMAFGIDKNKKIVIGISVGNEFEVNKKYRRKSTWFEK